MTHQTIRRSLGALAALVLLIATAGTEAQTAPASLGPMAQGAGFSGLNTMAPALRGPGYVDLLAGIAYTSNAFLTQGRPVADGIGFAGLDIDYLHQGPELMVDALGDVDRLEYVKGSFPGTFYGEFNGSAIFGQPTDLFQWQVGDAFGEGMINPLTAPTPTSLQTVNYARTGPILNFNIDTSNRITLSGLYSRTTFESSPFDSQSFDGSASFRHALSSVSSFSFQATDIRTDFLESAVTQSFPGATGGYDTRAASGGYASEFGRTQFSMYGGYNTVNYGGRNRGAPLAVLQFYREVSPFSTLFVTGQTGYSTLGNSLLSPTSAVDTAGTEPILATGAGASTGTAAAAPFQNTTGSLGWTYHRLRTTFTLLGMASDQRYVEGTSFDQTAGTINASVRHEFGPTFSAQLQGIETLGHFARIGADRHTTTAQLSLSKQFRHAIFTTYAQWLRQDSTAGTSGLEVASYNDARVGIELSYDLVGHKVVGAGF